MRIWGRILFVAVYPIEYLLEYRSEMLKTHNINVEKGAFERGKYAVADPRSVLGGETLVSSRDETLLVVGQQVSAPLRRDFGP